jgi:hypothetical protein
MPSPAATPVPLAFLFGPEVKDGDRAVIKAGISMASDYAEQLDGVESAGVTAYVYEDVTRLSVQWEGVASSAGVPVETLIRGLSRYVGETFPTAIFINTAAPEWRNLSSVEQLRLAAHEYFHTLQMTLVGPDVAKTFYSGAIDQPSVIGPNWLLEGSAEYLSWMTLEWLSLGELDTRIPSLQPGAPLRDLASYASFYGAGQPAYDASLAGVYRLASDRGPAGLISYYRYVGYGLTWQDAFLLAFGENADDFYEAYESAP